MDGMYAGFAAVRRPGAKTGHGCAALIWRFVLSTVFDYLLNGCLAEIGSILGCVLKEPRKVDT